MNASARALIPALLAALGPSVGLAADSPVPERTAYYGAVHVHTGYSFDAFTNGTVTTPAMAYEWARGKPIPGSKNGPQMRIKRPLDFYAVSDHAEYMGVFRQMGDPANPLSKLEIAKRITSSDPNVAEPASGRRVPGFEGGARPRDVRV